MHVSIKGNLNLESRQDSNHYDSKQTQAGAGFSVAIYGSGSSASANYSQNKAKVNYAQVEEQTGFHVGKGGMDVKVAGNTHLAGSVIDSEAAQDKNHFKTKSLTHTDIENHSEVEVKSVSAGLSTDMAQNAKNAMAAAASALGNKHESATSQTQSAIGSNIQIDTETPENLTALSRDTQNANHKVKAFDHNEVKEQQEAAQVAGELFSKITGDVAKAFEFEEGSKEKIAMHALAGALAAKMSDGNVATGVAAGAGSEWLNTYVTDYLNEQAKDLKLDVGQKEKLKQAAQQMTALAIGAAAGAGGALAGEVMADVIAKELYGKKPNQLNRGEKEVVSSVSQAAGALVGGAAANSSQGIGVGLTTTKNAVENNYLSKDDWDNYRKDLQNCQGNKQCQMDINKKYAKLDSEKHADLVAACKLGGSSSKCQTMSEEARDGVDYAVQEFYKPMFDGRNELWLRQRIEQGYSDSKKEPSVALLGDESLNNLNDMAKNPKVLKKLKSDENLRKEFIDAVDESTLAVRMEKSNAYEFGEGLSKYKNLVDLTDLTGGYKYFNREIPLESVYPEAFIAPFALRGAQAISSAEGLIVQGTSKVLPRVGMVAEKYPLLSELVVSGVINTGYQLSSKKEFSGDDLLKAELSTLFNRNKSLGQQTAINIGLNVMATTKPEDYGWNAISAVTGTLGSAAVSNGLSKVNISPSINKMVVPTGSAITSEYLGDAEKLKQYYRFLEEKYAK